MTPTDANSPAALGREVERLTRRSKANEKRAEELAELLATLATDVTTLVAREPGGDEGVRAWLLTEDPDSSRADLTDLTAWLARVYLRYPDAFLPSCWLWHPALIEELLWLRATHREAYHPKRGTWAHIGDWHNRYRLGVTRRIRTAYGSCELREHTEHGYQRLPAPQVPLTDAVDLTARAWTSMPDTQLIPTE
ncbi:MAG: hypothetical protein LC749_21655, partial [Actinobacteria bacterium]|nr:hypothetical protein [Actinomycetota bacterium]